MSRLTGGLVLQCGWPAAVRTRQFDNFVSGTAELVTAAGGEHFWPQMAALFSRLCEHHGCVVFRYCGSDPPEFVYTDFDNKAAKTKFSEYRKRAYVLDPFYEMFRARVPDSVVKLSDIAPDRFFRSAYYREYYRKTGASDEAGIFCWTGNESLTVVSFARRHGATPFGKAEIAVISRILPVVTACIKLHERMLTQAAPPPAQRGQPANDSPLMPAAGLTQRERAIAELILKGHSSLSVALVLGISVETVRVHRRNLYRKLDVSSQAQLFALAVQPPGA